jgi:hypothetical protein
MKRILTFLVLSSLSQAALSFSTGDTFKCSSDSLKENFTIKIVDAGDEHATVKIKTLKASRFYPESKVSFSQNSEGAQFITLDESFKAIEEIALSQEVSDAGIGLGTLTRQGRTGLLKCAKAN